MFCMDQKNELQHIDLIDKQKMCQMFHVKHMNDLINYMA